MNINATITFFFFLRLKLLLLFNLLFFLLFFNSSLPVVFYSFLNEIATATRNEDASNNNLLVKRWNASNYQANIYALSSIGLNIDSEKSMYNLGLHTDWENRRFMVMHMIEYSSFNESTKNSVRLAFTPKITDYKGTAVWLIGQYTNYSFDDKNNEMLMPVIRILKRNYLLEFGGNGNETFLTLMTHF